MIHANKLTGSSHKEFKILSKRRVIRWAFPVINMMKKNWSLDDSPVVFFPWQRHRNKFCWSLLRITNQIMHIRSLLYKQKYSFRTLLSSAAAFDLFTIFLGNFLLIWSRRWYRLIHSLCEILSEEAPRVATFSWLLPVYLDWIYSSVKCHQNVPVLHTIYYSIQSRQLAVTPWERETLKPFSAENSTCFHMRAFFYRGGVFEFFWVDWNISSTLGSIMSKNSWISQERFLRATSAEPSSQHDGSVHSTWREIFCFSYDSYGNTGTKLRWQNAIIYRP